MKFKGITIKLFFSVLATGLLSFCGIIVETSMNIMFPLLMKIFSVNTTTVQWMTTSYLLVIAIIVPLSAYFKQRFRMKYLFISANLMFILGVILDLIAPNFTVLLIGRIIQGVGTGIAMPLMFNIILEQVPTEKMGLMMGIGTLITAIGPALGPTFGGIIIAYFSWRMVFASLVPFLVISLVLGVINIQSNQNTKNMKFNLAEESLLAFSFICLILGMNGIGSQGKLDWKSGLELIVGIIVMVLFVNKVAHDDQKLLNIQIMKNFSFQSHVTAYFFFNVTSLSLAFILPNYVQLFLGKTALYASLMTLPGALVGALFAPLGGSILDKFGPNKPLTLGGGMALIALGLFSLTAEYLNSVMIIIIYVIYMFGMGLSFGNIMTNGITYLAKSKKADGNAIMNTLQQFAGAVGTAIASAIFEINQVASGLKQGTANGAKEAFIIILILLLISQIVLQLGLRKNTKEGRKK